MKFTRFVIAASMMFAFIIPAISHAAWSTPVKVLTIQAPPNGGAYFYLSGGVEHPDCPTARWMRLLPSLTSFKEVYANLMMAKAMDRNITVATNTGTCTSTTILTNPYVSVR